MKHIRSTKKRRSKKQSTKKQSTKKRRSMRSKSMRSIRTRRNRSRRMRGGSTSVVPGVTGAGSATTSASGQELKMPGYAPPPVLNPNAIYDAGARQNNIKGGGRGSRSSKYTHKKQKKQKKQKGGSGSWIDNLYGYKPPPGMMGPIPQPSQTMMTNNLVLDAARISLAGQVDSQYDKNVCSIPNK